MLFVTKCHTENSSQISHLCCLFFWLYSFSHHIKFMITREDRNNYRYKNWKPCGFWKLLFRRHGAIKLTQNCVCFTNPCINPFVPTSVTRTYHPKILEFLHLLPRADPGGAIGAIAPLKPTKVTSFTMILNDSENSICDKRPFCYPLFCHSSVAKSTSSLLQ